MDIMFIFRNISKVFDKGWHKNLIYKLQKYIIRGEILDGLNTVLLIERQKTKRFHGCHSSEIESINAGVHKGSVLGLFLFLIYINDIVENISNQILFR